MLLAGMVEGGNRPPIAVLALSAALGVALGVATFLAFWSLYPVPRGGVALVLLVAVAAAVVMTALYLVLRLRAAAGIADWFGLGYALGLVAVAIGLMAGEFLSKFRRWLPPT